MKPLPLKIYIWAINIWIIVTLMHWRLTFAWEMVLFVFGSLIGLHFLDVFEYFVFGTTNQSRVSIFRTVFVQVLLFILALFLLTSSTSLIGKGVVLFLHLRLLFLLIEAYQQKRLPQWFNQTSMPEHTQKAYVYLSLIGFSVLIGLFVLI